MSKLKQYSYEGKHIPLPVQYTKIIDSSNNMGLKQVYNGFKQHGDDIQTIFKYKKQSYI